MRISYLIFLVLIWWPFPARAQGADTLCVAFTGDIMMHGPQIQGAFDTRGGRYDFDASFGWIAPWLAAADAVAGNLETTLVKRNYTGYPRFGAPEVLALALQRAGFTHLMTANNHSCDRDAEGIVNTAATLDKLNLAHTGSGGLPADSVPYTEIRKGRIRLAVLNYTYGTNGLPVPQGCFVNILDSTRIRRDVEKLRAAGRFDDIIVFLHWGRQYRTSPSPEQRRWEKFLHRLGIRIIIGNHPHVVEPVVWNKEKEELTAYSLGNFISNQRDFPRDGSIVLWVRWVKRGEALHLDDVRYMPVWVYKYRTGERWHFEVLPTSLFVLRKNYFDNYTDFRKMVRYHLYITGFLNELPQKTLPGGLVKPLPQPHLWTLPEVKLWPQNLVRKKRAGRIKSQSEKKM